MEPGYEAAETGSGSEEDKSITESSPRKTDKRNETPKMAYSKDARMLADADLFFAGVPGESAEAHIRKFEEFVELHGLNERDQTKYLLLSWKGPVQDWWLCKSRTLVTEAEQRALEDAAEAGEGVEPASGRAALTYDFLKEHFLKRFRAPHQKHVAQQELIRIRQKPGEQVTELAGRIQKLGATAFGHLSDEDRQDCLIHYFVNALTDRQLKLQTLSSKPETFESAYETASLLEASKQLLDEDGARAPRQSP